MKSFWLWSIIPFCLFTKSPDFELISAISKKWTAGMQGGGSGVNYRIIIVANRPEKKLSFSYLKVGGEIIEIKVNKLNKLNNSAHFEKGDTLVISGSQRILPDYKIDKENLDVTDELMGEGHVFYKKKKKELVFTVDKFEKKKYSPIFQ